MRVLLSSLNESIKCRVRRWLGVPEPATDAEWRALSDQIARGMRRVQVRVVG